MCQIFFNYFQILTDLILITSPKVTTFIVSSFINKGTEVDRMVEFTLEPRPSVSRVHALNTFTIYIKSFNWEV